MSVKKLINNPENCVDECLNGLYRSFPSLIFSPGGRTVFYGIHNANRRVSILSGGGSGHEPFPSGYVGEGMLTGSVSGSIFTSPPKNDVLNAIRLLSENDRGVFIIIPNYTGDRLNFGLALETARKQGIQVESIVVGDDIALETYGMENKCGRRGICGLVIVLKMAGFLSKEGESLHSIKTVTESVTDNLASVGVAIEPCTLPGSQGPLFHLKPDRMKFGVGVHGEDGVCEMNLKSAAETVEILLNPLIKYLKIGEGDEVVALVNNLGTLSQLEQWILAGEVEKYLSGKRVKLSRMYVGPLFTSLNMAGIQISLLKLIPSLKELVLKALDDPTNAPAWPGSSLSAITMPSNVRTQVRPVEPRSFSGGLLTDSETMIVERCLVLGSNAIIDNVEKINYLDSGCGDGDCGTTVARLAKEVLEKVRDKTLPLSSPEGLLAQLGEIAEGTMGGTSGAIYGLFFMGSSMQFTNNASVRDPKVWAKAWSSGVAFIKKYSTARIGDRTLIVSLSKGQEEGIPLIRLLNGGASHTGITANAKFQLDALEPGSETFEKCLNEDHCPREAFSLAVESAKEGCSKTRNMKASIGRASYVDSSALKEVDAGAYTVCLWLTVFHSVLVNEITSKDSKLKG